MARGADVEWVMAAVNVLALAGRRIDAPGAPPKFPLDSLALVKERVRGLLVQQKTDVLVCAAASGADLIALGEARALGLRRRIVLPFAVGRFRSASVTDRPGDSG